ncbi:MAG: hypothetical protein PHX62_00080 [Bacilli bacterium]|nr:hypothetical protein [Bacilli bacterium]
MSKIYSLSDVIKENLIQNTISEIMAKIKLKELLYSNEEQFQFDLAWKLKQKINNNNIDILLEPLSITDLKLGGDRKKDFTDIVLIDDEGNFIPIELKYKKYGEQKHEDCKYILYKIKPDKKKEYDIKLYHDGAVNLGRFDYLWDVHRIENLRKKNSKNDGMIFDNRYTIFLGGYAIMITNDEAYWRDTGDNNCSNLMLLDIGKVVKKLKWQKSNRGESKSILNSEKYFSCLDNIEDCDKDTPEIEQKQILLNNGEGYEISGERVVLEENKKGFTFKSFIINVRGE